MQYNLNKYLGIINISGAEAATFLQGQLTNDIYQLNADNNLQISAHLSHKGRIIANFIVIYAGQDNFYLLTILALIPNMIKRLSMFKLRSKVHIEEVNKHLVLADAIAPSHELTTKLFNQYLLISSPSTTPESSSGKDDHEAWLEFIIDNSLAMVYDTTGELFVPQDVNLDLIGAVSFKKGCYIGQEIVARLHYLGKPKRRMYRFKIANANGLINHGDKLIAPSINNQEIGYIVEVLANNGSYIGLCSCYIAYTHEVYHQLSNAQLMLSVFSFKD